MGSMRCAVFNQVRRVQMEQRTMVLFWGVCNSSCGVPSADALRVLPRVMSFTCRCPFRNPGTTWTAIVHGNLILLANPGRPQGSPPHVHTAPALTMTTGVFAINIELIDRIVSHFNHNFLRFQGTKAREKAVILRFAQDLRCFAPLNMTRHQRTWRRVHR